MKNFKAKRAFLSLAFFAINIAMIGHATATAYVAIAEAPIYAAPTADAPILGTLHWDGWTIFDDEIRQKTAPVGWVAIVGEELPAYPSGWVRREQLATPTDFKPFVGCWPVRISDPSTGEAPWEITFKTNGAAVIKPLNVPYYSKEAYTGRVYMAGNMIFVKANKRTKDTVGFFGFGFLALPYAYEPATKVLKPLNSWDADTLLFSRNELEGCTTIRLSR